MRAHLKEWIVDKDIQQAMADFHLPGLLEGIQYLGNRTFDLYHSLVGELFDTLRKDTAEPQSWSILGNAFLSISREFSGSTRSDALFFAAASFYFGGFPASAVMIIRDEEKDLRQEEVYRDCFDLLTRSITSGSSSVRALLEGVREGNQWAISSLSSQAEEAAHIALGVGPSEWVAARLYSALVARFACVNLRAVLPDGTNEYWTPLVESFARRENPIWEFFPSQITAIEQGLLVRKESYSLQMPTGAGKTALTETLLYSHLAKDPDSKAVLLVPYRALARELRHSIGRNLSRMGFRTRTIYGGSVPTMEEREGLDEVRVLIATPEALSGLFSADADLASSVSLVVCDEGHLLANGKRGVNLELLLTRFRSRAPQPRIVFVSAIVPNIEEVNSWLGGTDSTVIRSTYRPSVADYAVLDPSGAGRNLRVKLEMKEVSTGLPAHSLPDFLSVNDFEYINKNTGRRNTFEFRSMKAQAIATARKALPIGTVALFSATKRGNQGVMGLAEGFLNQVEAGIPLPNPTTLVRDPALVRDAAEYLKNEYGDDWIVTRSLDAGVVVHHGDLPQETREVLEELLISRAIPMVICTSTLAEGINLPIRTMVLYSVQRRTSKGEPIPMLSRDIKNLVGRAGRAGSSTRGLVICVNPTDWNHVQPVALDAPGERVEGALIDLLRRLERAVARIEGPLSNEDLENAHQLFALIDGIDATLMELISEEIGEEQFSSIANKLASETFAATQSTPEEQDLLNHVFRLRAARFIESRNSGQLALVRETGTRLRLVPSVLNDLAQRYEHWDSCSSVLDDSLLEAVVGWAMDQPGFKETAQTHYEKLDVPDQKQNLKALVKAWIEGHTYQEMSALTGLEINAMLNIHASLVLFDLTTLVEQAVPLLETFRSSQGQAPLSTAIAQLPGLLRHGTPTTVGRELITSGVRHRRAAIELAKAIESDTSDRIILMYNDFASELIKDKETWLPRLGTLVYTHTLKDLSST